MAKPFGQAGFALLVAVLFGWVAPASAITIDVPSGSTSDAVSDLTTESDGLTKTGAGTLIIWNPQSYTGATAIQAGQIMIGGTGSISSQSALQVDSTASINLTGWYALNNINRTFAGLTGSGVVYGEGGTVTINKVAGSDTFGGQIQGAHGFIKDGAGTLVLTAANIHTGGTTISGGTLDLNGGSVSGAIVNNGNLSIRADLANAVSGTGSLTKNGSGTAFLWTANSYTGATIVNAGQIALGGSGAISSSSAVQIASGASINLTGDWAPNNINRTIGGLTGAGILYGGGGTVTVNKTSGTDTFSGDIQGAQGLIKSGAGTLVLTASNSYTGGTTVSGGTLALHGGSVRGGITNNANVSITGDLANAVSGTGSLTKTGGAEAYLWDPNTYTGATVVEAGTLTLGGSGAISESTALQINSGAAVNLTGNWAANNINRTVAGLTGAGVLYGGGGTVTINKVSGSDTFSGDIQGAQGLVKSGAGTLVLTGANSYTGGTTISGGTLDLNGGSVVGGIINNGNLVIRDALANAVSGTGSLTKTGAAEAYLWTANSYTGATVVEAGTLTLGGIGAISQSSVLQINSGAAVNLTGMWAANNINRTVAGLTGAGVLYGGGGTVTVNTASGTDTFSGDIQGAQGLVKSGAGNLVLSGASSYTGTTTVNEGRLVVAHADALGGTAGGTIVATGAQLRINTLADTVFAAEPLVISGDGLPSGGALRNATNNNTWKGNITLMANATIGAASGTTLTLEAASGATLNLETYNLVVDGAGIVQVNGGIAGSGQISKTGSGQLVASNNVLIATILSNSVSVHFANPPGDGTFAVLSGPLDSASLATTAVTGLAGGASGTFTNNPNLQVIVTTASANQKPVIDSGLGFSISENSPLGVSVGTLTATDADGNGLSGWAIVSGNDDGVFALDPATGELTVAGILDHEIASSYTLMVTVSDGTETSDSAMVSVSVVNVPEFADVFGSADPSADSNGDGISNLMAYALGASASNATVSRPVTTVNSSNLIITALVRTNDPAVQVRGSATINLASWTNPPILGTPAADQTGAVSGVTQRQEFTVERGSDPKKFLRLKATLQP